MRLIDADELLGKWLEDSRKTDKPLDVFYFVSSLHNAKTININTERTKEVENDIYRL